MAEQIFEILPDGTLLTDDMVEKIVNDVYIALDKGNFRSILNPHGKIKPQKITDPHLHTELQDMLAEM
ncbi:MAG: hypothetical protein Ta2G_03960 [Termitinemataceae bacterium]|nr:MAG: hypothetical protein Ta2G_03960 [Termitinemataceae bacterium]